MTRITPEHLIAAFDLAQKRSPKDVQFGDDTPYHDLELQMLDGNSATVDGVVDFGAVADALSEILNGGSASLVDEKTEGQG